MSEHHKANNLFCLISFFVLISFASSANEGHPDTKPTKFYVSVVNESGDKLDGADVSVSIFQEGGVRKYFSGASVPLKPLSINTHSLGIATVRVEMNGFYTHLQKLNLKPSNDKARYEPWAYEYVVTLKKQINPRPLYTHRVNWLAVPEFDKPVGFDLEKADWVAPHGKGLHSDFVFTLNRRLGEGEEYTGTMVLTFTNHFDGLIPIIAANESKSFLLLGREAPLHGYTAPYRRFVGVEKVNGKLKLTDEPMREELQTYEGFWFRVRSEVDDSSGDLTRARYGKLDGFLDFAVREKNGPGYIRFVYYLAPDDSRSLEFNGKSLVQHADLQSVNKH